MPVIFNLMYLITHPELSVRRTASQTTESLLVSIKRLPGREQYEELLVQGIVYPAIKKALAVEGGSREVQKEFVQLLGAVVHEFPGRFAALHALAPRDSESSFFMNVLHIQQHRRMRALAEFRRVLQARPMPQTFIVAVFVPLFVSMLHEHSAGLRKKKGDDDDDADAADEDSEKHVALLDSLIQCLAGVAGHLKWPRYLPHHGTNGALIVVAQTRATFQPLASTVNPTPT